jgi:hypothetical protein
MSEASVRDSKPSDGLHPPRSSLESCAMSVVMTKAIIRKTIRFGGASASVREV